MHCIEAISGVDQSQRDWFSCTST